MSADTKMLHEALCVAQSALVERASGGRDIARVPFWIAQIGSLIAAIDEHRPLGPDGKHGDRHTATCGCDGPRPPFDERTLPMATGDYPPLHPSAHTTTTVRTTPPTGFTEDQDLRVRALGRAYNILGEAASVWDAIAVANYIIDGADATRRGMS